MCTALLGFAELVGAALHVILNRFWFQVYEVNRNITRNFTDLYTYRPFMMWVGQVLVRISDNECTQNLRGKTSLLLFSLYLYNSLWNNVIVAKLVKKCPAVHGTKMLNTMYTSSYHWPLLWARWIHLLSYFLKIPFNIILPYTPWPSKKPLPLCINFSLLPCVLHVMPLSSCFYSGKGTSWSRGNTLGLYSGGASYESLSGQWLSFLFWVLGVFRISSR
jgi:hypothetical protein